MTATISVHMVRHGESGWNLARRVQGQSPQAPSLTELGRAQARTAAELLAELAPRARLVLSSDLPRARETALIVAARLGLPLRLDPGLREQDLGELEGRRFDGVLRGGTVEDAVDRLWRDTWRRPRGGESIRDLHHRVREALSQLAAGPSPEIIVVSHGGPIRVARAASLAAVRRGTVGNASVTTVGIAAAPDHAWRARLAS